MQTFIINISNVSFGDIFKWGIIIFVIMMVISFIVSFIDTDKHELKKAAKAQARFEKEQKQAGDDYEREVSRALSKVLGDPIKNVIMPHPNGNDTETDIVYVDKKGIWLIECKEHGKTYKDYSKQDEFVISGYTQASELTVSSPTGDIFSMKNPLKQNNHHYEAVDSMLERAGVSNRCLRCVSATNCHFSLIDFGQTVTDLSTGGFYDLRNGDSIMRIGSGSKWKKTFTKWHDELDDLYSDADVTKLRLLLKQFEADEVTRAAHDRIAAQHNREYDDRF